MNNPNPVHISVPMFQVLSELGISPKPDVTEPVPTKSKQQSLQGFPSDALSTRLGHETGILQVPKRKWRK